MGRSPCCEKVGLKKGPWTPEEDQKLLAYIEEHGHGSWRALPQKAGLERCGKSCRLRWTNYLRPDIKRGKFSLQEEQTIIQLHALLGNRWSAIATHLSKRTDNEIKNYWNTHLKKKLTKMGIDPVTHKPKNDAILSSQGNSKSAANLSHMAQWESARLEAEARLVRESKLRSQYSLLGIGNTSSIFPSTTSPSSSSSTSKQDANIPIPNSLDASIVREEGDHQEWKLGYENLEIENSMPFTYTLQPHELTMFTWPSTSSSSQHHQESLRTTVAEEGFTDLLLSSNTSNSSDRSLSPKGGGGSDFYEDNKNYWNSFLNLMNSSPSDSPMF